MDTIPTLRMDIDTPHPADEGACAALAVTLNGAVRGARTALDGAGAAHSDADRAAAEGAIRALEYAARAWGALYDASLLYRVSATSAGPASRPEAGPRFGPAGGECDTCAPSRVADWGAVGRAVLLYRAAQDSDSDAAWDAWHAAAHELYERAGRVCAWPAHCGECDPPCWYG